MGFTAVIFLLLGIVILFLIIINGFLLFLLRNTNNKIDALLEKGKVKEFKDIFLSQKNKSEELEQKIEEAFLKIKNLEEISKITIQKTAIIRFNPFNDVGGNQSFVIALLDGQDNGFVVTSLFVKEANRVYSKTIKNGKSDSNLSKEEKEAVAKACKYN